MFSAFDRGGWDVFAVQEPVGSDGVLRSLQRDAAAAVITADDATHPAVRASGAAVGLGALATAWPDSTIVPDTTAGNRRGGRRGPLPTIAGEPPSSGPLAGFTPGHGQLSQPLEHVLPDTAARLPERTPLLERGGAFALADSVP